MSSADSFQSDSSDIIFIIRMYTEGFSKKTISEKSGCSRNTVKKYINQFIALGKSFDELNQLSNTALEALFKAEEPAPSSKLEVLRSYFPEMEKALKRKGVTREMLWRKYIEENPDGYQTRSSYFMSLGYKAKF